MSLTKYAEYGQAIQNGLPKLFKKLGIAFNHERETYIVDNFNNTIQNFTNAMRGQESDITTYKENAKNYMNDMFFDSLTYLVKCKLEDSVNEPNKEQDDKDKQFYSNFVSFMQGTFNAIFAPSILESSLEEMKNYKGINKDLMPTDINKVELHNIFNEATDSATKLRREGKYTAKELTLRVNNSAYNYDNERMPDEDKLSSLARDYINLKNQYESRGRFERFFTGGASRIAMRKAESRLKAAWKANPNGMTKFDAEKYALKMTKPSKMFSNVVESFNEENIHLDATIKNQFELDKALKDNYTQEERAEIESFEKKYKDTIFSHKAVNTNNLSIKQAVAYKNAVDLWNNMVDNKVSSIRQDQVKQLKEYANNLLKTKDNKQLSTIVKMSNSRKQLTEEINKYCTNNNLEIPNLESLNSDEIIDDWKKKRIDFSLKDYLGVETKTKVKFNDEFKKENDEPLNEINTDKVRRKSNINLDVSISEAGVEKE